MKYYLSRAFVEFGPFEAAELADFGRRGILRGGDYVRPERSSHWTPWEDGLPEPGSPAPEGPRKKGTPARKTAAAAKAPTKAPAKKKAVRKAPANKPSPGAA